MDDQGVCILSEIIETTQNLLPRLEAWQRQLRTSQVVFADERIVLLDLFLYVEIVWERLKPLRLLISRKDDPATSQDLRDRFRRVNDDLSEHERFQTIGREAKRIDYRIRKDNTFLRLWILDDVEQTVKRILKVCLKWRENINDLELAIEICTVCEMLLWIDKARRYGLILRDFLEDRRSSPRIL